jgi:hypothetical protein
MVTDLPVSEFLLLTQGSRAFSDIKHHTGGKSKHNLTHLRRNKLRPFMDLITHYKTRWIEKIKKEEALDKTNLELESTAHTKTV